MYTTGKIIKILNISRPTLYKLCKSKGISPVKTPGGNYRYSESDLKRLLNSKSNSFFFITTMVVSVDNGIATPFLEYVRNKIIAINDYMNKQLLPDFSDPYVDKKACFFCTYSRICGK